MGDFIGNLDESYRLRTAAFMVDYESRIVPISNISFGELTPQMTMLMKLDKVSNAPIDVIIRSRGGFLDEALVFIEVMQSLKSPIHTIAVDCCTDTALLIFCAGGTRSAYKETCFTAKCSTMDIDQMNLDSSNAKVMKEIKKTDEKILSILESASNKKGNWWQRKIKKESGEFPFDIDDAIGFGIINGKVFNKDEKLTLGVG